MHAHALVDPETVTPILPAVAGAGAGAGIRTQTHADAEFAAWCHEVLPRVFRFVSRMTTSRADAEDLASEALARAYARWSSVRDLPNRDGWVMRTAANLTIDAARHTNRFPWDRLHSQRGATAPAMEDQVTDRRTLALALAQLPTRQRHAVALRYLGGLTVEETAAAMGLRPETIRTHTSRGLEALRAGLRNWIEEMDRARF